MSQPDDHEERYRRAARRIQFLLDNHRLPAHEAARQLGVRKTVLQDILDGRSFPTEGLLRKIAAHFRVDLDFLVGSTEIAEPPTPTSTTAPAGVAGPPPQSTAPRPARPSATSVPGSDPPKAESPPQRAGRTRSTPGVSLRTLAIRHQALVELLVSKGVLTAAEYRAQVEAIDDRAGAKA
ncbi:MAG: helix-turn-helix domain-containing protein [Planctomycetota bacterium]